MKLAIEGTIVMSDDLRLTLDNMYDARLPEKWAKLSWQSTTLGFWYTELLERDGQFRRWCYHGRPKVCHVKRKRYAVSYNPSSFNVEFSQLQSVHAT